MKKLLIATLLGLTFGAQAANYVQVEQEHVNGRKGADGSEVSYVRFGKDVGDYNLGVQSRTARFNAGGIASSLEVTGSNKNVSAFGITPFVGVGHDNGFNGGAGYNYGLVGATYGRPVGPGFLLTGIKTRVGSTEDGARTKQTVGFATYSIPVAKQVSLNLNASRSGQTIKENAFGVGLGFSF